MSGKPAGATSSEGMASGDIDKDTNVDLILKGVWVRNPGGDSAHIASNWTQYTIGILLSRSREE
jgi:hypothetical protein